jgi:peptidoglycan/xylan/chitin deacetylase (PgdA/CDA1 family)
MASRKVWVVVCLVGGLAAANGSKPELPSARGAPSTEEARQPKSGKEDRSEETGDQPEEAEPPARPHRRVRVPPWPSPAAGPSRSGDPEVIFTFDDGPHDIYTKRILDELAARRLHAIFYVVGERVQGPTSKTRQALVAREVSEGHILANHTVHHVHLCKVEEEKAAREIDLNRTMLEELSGLPVRLFRAPYGDNCDRLQEMLKERGIAHMHWDVDPREWSHGNAERTARHVIGQLRRLRGRAVVLMHDTHLATARALPEILDWIERENQRRSKSGRRTIRVLSGSDLLGEELEQPLAAWARKTGEAARAGLVSSLRRTLP